MTRLKNLFPAAFILVTLVGSVWGVYKIAMIAWAAFSQLNPQVAAALVTGFFTITVSISAVAIGRYLEKAKEVNSAYREKRLKVYEDFMARLLNLMQTGADSASQQEDMTAFLRDFNKKILLWAGPHTLKAYTQFFVAISTDSTSNKTVFALENFFKAVRRDLGLSNFGLQKGDLLHLILKADEVLILLSEHKKNPAVRLEDVTRIKNERRLPTNA